MFQFISNKIRLSGAADSFRGGRPENQDNLAFCDTPSGFLMVVCDGMGGGPGGKTASTLAVQEMVRILSSMPTTTDRAQAFRLAAGSANEALEQAMKQNPALVGMGSTFVAILINGQSACVAHAGDSRCYKLHGRREGFRTTDHSLVAELTQKKVLTEEEARTSPQSNIITRGLGSTTNHTPDIEEVPYGKGDRFVLCTDGVWGIMPRKDLLGYLGENCAPKLLISKLAAEIERRGQQEGGHHDNFTMAIIDMEGSSDLTSKSLWKKCSIALAALLIIVLGVYIAFKIYSPDTTSPKTSYTNGPAVATGDHPSGTGSGKYSPSNFKSGSSDTQELTADSTPTSEEGNSQKEILQHIQSLNNILDSLFHCKETEEKRACKRQDSLYNALKENTQPASWPETGLKGDDSIQVDRLKDKIKEAVTDKIINKVQKKDSIFIPTEKAKKRIKSVQAAVDSLEQKIKS